MKDSLPRYTLRVPRELLDKLAYIAAYEGRTKNKELEQLIKNVLPNLNLNTASFSHPLTNPIESGSFFLCYSHNAAWRTAFIRK